LPAQLFAVRALLQEQRAGSLSSPEEMSAVSSRPLTSMGVDASLNIFLATAVPDAPFHDALNSIASFQIS
jgi:hypothetical protein